MSSEDRRLAAIVFTDMVGYTALIQTDEARGLRLLEKQRELVRNLISKYGGREVKTVGDSFLIEFTSALRATEFSIQLQRSLNEYNKAATEAEKLKIRIGIHVGDLVHKEGDVYGDAVNVASRIEPLAKGGGICVTGQVFAEVRNKIPFRVIKMEDRELKNVLFPVDVYTVELPWEEPVASSSEKSVLSSERIAVLPFLNIGPDPNDEYLADGLTEELILKLSLVKGLEVISRTSVMTYKKKEKKISEIGSELKAGTLLEGSVRSCGKKIRVTAQLINARTESHLWASNYDRDMDDIFTLQSEIASRVVESVPANIVLSKTALKREKETDDLGAYISYLEGKHLLHTKTEESMKRAFNLFEGAVQTDPRFARAFVGMAECALWLGERGAEPYAQSVERAKTFLEKALAVNSSLGEAHATLSLIKLSEDNIADAETEASKAVELNPNLAVAYWVLGEVKATQGYPEDSVKSAEAAYTLDPLEPNIITSLGRMYFYSNRDSEAVDFWKTTSQLYPSRILPIVAEFYLGKNDYGQAADALAKLESVSPGSRWLITWRGCLAALTGRREDSMRMIEKLEEISKEGSVTATLVGFIYAALGDRDRFFERMEQAMEMHALPVVPLRYSPIFAKVREDPRFHELFGRLGLSAVAQN